MSTFVSRLKQAIALREHELGERILKKEIAAAAGVTSSAVTLWIQGKTHDLRADPILRLAKFLRVRVEWLKDNKGPMRDEPGSSGAVSPPPEADESRSPISKEAKRLIAAIQDADRAGSISKEALRAMHLIFEEATRGGVGQAAHPLSQLEPELEHTIARRQPSPRKRTGAA